MSEKHVIVIGHKNPDTDSVCSAICYARLKNKAENTDRYIPARCGHLNDETRFVLKTLGVEPPKYVTDVRPQVKDIEIRHTKGVESTLSVREGYRKMKEANIFTLPITDGSKVAGLVTIGDIARSSFEIYDNEILARSKTRYTSIVETLNGHVVTGDADREVTGKVVISAANPELMETYIEEGDVVILGNRYESQISAIATGAACLIVCEGEEVAKSIIKLAEASNTLIIVTPYDTYMVARMIDQSMPVSFFMREREKLTCFTMESYLEDIHDTMATKRYRDFPIEDSDGNYVGMISRRNLLGAGRKQVILMDHNEESQAVAGVKTADILEIIDHHRLGSLQTMGPLYFRGEPLGCTCTIVAEIYREKQVKIDKETAALLCSAIISDTLLFRSPTCTALDKATCEKLAEKAGINLQEYAAKMFAAAGNLKNKPAEELLHQDYKTFEAGKVRFGVGQVTSMSSEELASIENRMAEYMQEAVSREGLGMMFFMLTDILSESSIVLGAGKGAVEALVNTFGVEADGPGVYLKGVVSRKKQLVPPLIETLTEK
ncbi:MAG: putative manganese-dependent inorganic diphosphatase [Lachnospiraceae bacterium]|jgi:manganese-dependent inorganic pyrophosphatase|nr:putative manganese-dependent inorganic diphosphatase [Lachnospiraceae bacterium]MCH4029913.1 putative manganese-dependent inorganic diphosphatase [Lachnospiraceae bacterium]MCH4070426.1 putative manganese-dependent inorganic diphosphatase [Lachnospiraceae bacterium]MCI1303022.1 putative manganese-dependent inorganic diphosphatase [Lachnospiraceae bacterium]MCI1332388.1 putative manganese-dependent inorganic diphosphatase [Lachnospiraceae bacterium]